MAKRKKATKKTARKSAKKTASKKKTTQKAGTKKATAKKARKSAKKKSPKRAAVKAKVAKKATKKAARKTAKKAAKKKAAKKTKAPKKTAKKKVTRKKAAKKATPKKATKRTAKKAAKKATPKKAAKKKTAKKKVVRKAVTRTAKKAAKKATAPKKAARKTTPAKAKQTTKTKKAKTARRVPTPKAAPQARLETPKAPPESRDVLPVLDLESFEAKPLVEPGVKDEFVGSTRYAWLGSGQCGGRLVKSFYDLGYKKVIAANTTHHDLDLLDIPADQKFLMDIGEFGAGKDMGRGRDAVSRCRQELLHEARQKFGTEVEHIMVCFGAGGGTGGGSALEMIGVAKDYARSIGKKEPARSVGVIMTLPTIGEAASPQVAQNAYNVANEVGQLAMEGQISPLIIIDNEKISRMYPGLTVKDFWPSINSTVASLFDIFNRLSSLSSPYTSLDPVDYQSIVRAGGCAIMGLTKVSEYQDRFALSSAVRRNLEKTLLCDGFDLASAKVAGCAVVGGKSMMAQTPALQDNINYAFDVLAEITGNATIHRGIYEDQRNSLRVYTIIGGLDFPAARIEKILTPA